MVDGDNTGNKGAFEIFGFLIKLSAKFHDLNTMGAEGGTDRWSRIGGGGRNGEFNNGSNFFGHG